MATTMVRTRPGRQRHRPNRGTSGRHNTPTDDHPPFLLYETLFRHSTRRHGRSLVAKAFPQPCNRGLWTDSTTDRTAALDCAFQKTLRPRAGALIHVRSESECQTPLIGPLSASGNRPIVDRR